MSLQQYHLIGVRLYYHLLKLHRVKLPKDLREFGDKYLQQEFREHRKANEEQYKQFLDEWIKYYRQLADASNVKQFGKNIDPELMAYFNQEQKDSLEKLKKAVKS